MTQHSSPSRDPYHYLYPTPWHTSPQFLFYSPRLLSQFKTLTCRSCCVLKFRLFPPYISLAGTMPSEPPKPSRLLSSPRTFLRFLRGKYRDSGRVLCYDKRKNYRNAPGHKRRDVDDPVPCVDPARAGGTIAARPIQAQKMQCTAHIFFQHPSCIPGTNLRGGGGNG